MRVDAPGDPVPQNNRATSFTSVRGEPRVLVISADPEAGQTAWRRRCNPRRLEVKATGLNGFPGTLAEMQSYDAIFLSNVAAGDLGEDAMKLLESAVRDFGVGLVCVGGDQTYAAGGYRGTPLEATLPVNMELDSKKVLPSGAVALVMHGMEFANGNQVARDCALGVLDALGPQDEMGVVLWDGTERWLFPMTTVGDKKELGRKIAGMNQGDLPSFQGPMEKAHEALKKSTRQSQAHDRLQRRRPRRADEGVDAGDRRRPDHREHGVDCRACGAGHDDLDRRPGARAVLQCDVAERSCRRFSSRRRR